jgi:hypothetical protein
VAVRIPVLGTNDSWVLDVLAGRFPVLAVTHVGYTATAVATSFVTPELTELVAVVAVVAVVALPAAIEPCATHAGAPVPVEVRTWPEVPAALKLVAPTPDW